MTTPGLWNASFGELGATLRELEKRGVTLDHLKLVRSDAAAADKVARAFLTAVENTYANEEVRSNYDYPRGYVVKPVAEQIRELGKHLELSSVHIAHFVGKTLPTLTLPAGAEGWFAIPKWQVIGETYEVAVLKVFRALAASREFTNYREGQLGGKYLREHERTVAMMEKLSETHEGDIVIVPAQFGKRHRGRSVRRARALFEANEFGLSAFAVGCMLLTHPEREVQWKQIHIDCAGDEFSPDADEEWVHASLFYWHGGRLRFSTLWADYPHGYCGSASGFLPK